MRNNRLDKKNNGRIFWKILQYCSLDAGIKKRIMGAVFGKFWKE